MLFFTVHFCFFHIFPPHSLSLHSMPPSTSPFLPFFVPISLAPSLFPLILTRSIFSTFFPLSSQNTFPLYRMLSLRFSLSCILRSLFLSHVGPSPSPSVPFYIFKSYSSCPPDSLSFHSVLFLLPTSLLLVPTPLMKSLPPSPTHWFVLHPSLFFLSPKHPSVRLSPFPPHVSSRPYSLNDITPPFSLPLALSVSVTILLPVLQTPFQYIFLPFLSTSPLLVPAPLITSRTPSLWQTRTSSLWQRFIFTKNCNNGTQRIKTEDSG